MQHKLLSPNVSAKLIGELKRAYGVDKNQQRVVDRFFEIISEKKWNIIQICEELGLEIPKIHNAETIAKAMFRQWGQTFDQGEPFSHLFHALKTLRGCMSLLVNLREELRSFYRQITGNDWSPENVQMYIPKGSVALFLQGALVHDLFQIAINKALESVDPGYKKSDDVNDGHDRLGGEVMGMGGVFPAEVVGIVTRHGQAKLLNSQMPGYTLSKTSQETLGARLGDGTLDEKKLPDVAIRHRLFRLMEDYDGKKQGESEGQLIDEITQLSEHPLFRSIFSEEGKGACEKLPVSASPNGHNLLCEFLENSPLIHGVFTPTN